MVDGVAALGGRQAAVDGVHDARWIGVENDAPYIWMVPGAEYLSLQVSQA